MRDRYGELITYKNTRTLTVFNFVVLSKSAKTTGRSSRNFKTIYVAYYAMRRDSAGWYLNDGLLRVPGGIVEERSGKMSYFSLGTGRERRKRISYK